MSTAKIAIIGAGPAGLTLARILQKNGISVTIYEAEPNRHSRNQGGTLDIHQKYGQLALAEVRWEQRLTDTTIANVSQRRVSSKASRRLHVRKANA